MSRQWTVGCAGDCGIGSRGCAICRVFGRCANGSGSSSGSDNGDGSGGSDSNSSGGNRGGNNTANADALTPLEETEEVEKMEEMKGRRGRLPLSLGAARRVDAAKLRIDPDSHPTCGWKMHGLAMGQDAALR